MKKCLLLLLPGVFICGCGGEDDVREIEWRAKAGYEETGGKKEALAAAKAYMTGSVRDLAASFRDTESADFSHVEYDIVEEDGGYCLTGRYIAIYHSTGKPSGFPGGYFILKISKDGNVERIASGE